MTARHNPKHIAGEKMFLLHDTVWIKSLTGYFAMTTTYFSNFSKAAQISGGYYDSTKHCARRG